MDDEPRTEPHRVIARGLLLVIGGTALVILVAFGPMTLFASFPLSVMTFLLGIVAGSALRIEDEP